VPRRYLCVEARWLLCGWGCYCTGINYRNGNGSGNRLPADRHPRLARAADYTGTRRLVRRALRSYETGAWLRLDQITLRFTYEPLFIQDQTLAAPDEAGACSCSRQAHCVENMATCGLAITKCSRALVLYRPCGKSAHPTPGRDALLQSLRLRPCAREPGPPPLSYLNHDFMAQADGRDPAPTGAR